MNLDELSAGIMTAMGGTPAADLCIELVSKLVEIDPAHAKFLTYTSIMNVVGVTSLTPPLLDAVHFLTSSRYSILKAHGQLVDGCGDEYTLSDDEFADVLLSNEVVHPYTGETIHNAQDHIVPFFELVLR